MKGHLLIGGGGSLKKHLDVKAGAAIPAKVQDVTVNSWSPQSPLEQNGQFTGSVWMSASSEETVNRNVNRRNSCEAADWGLRSKS